MLFTFLKRARVRSCNVALLSDVNAPFLLHCWSSEWAGSLKFSSEGHKTAKENMIIYNK